MRELLGSFLAPLGAAEARETGSEATAIESTRRRMGLFIKESVLQTVDWRPSFFLCSTSRAETLESGAFFPENVGLPPPEE
jgi:hypothetical protein